MKHRLCPRKIITNFTVNKTNAKRDVSEVTVCHYACDGASFFYCF